MRKNGAAPFPWASSLCPLRLQQESLNKHTPVPIAPGLFQISVCRADDRCHFLVSAQESNQRKRLKGARPSSRSTRVPLKNPPAPSPEVRCKTAGRRERSRRHEQDHDDVPSRRESVTQAFRCVRERYIGEGAFVVREHGISASPMAASFGPFLAETRKGRTVVSTIN